MSVTITNFSGGVDAVEPSASLINTSNYLLSLCNNYKFLASTLISASGGTISPIVPSGGTDIYPFIITSVDFEADGVTYVNTNIVGDDLSLFANQFSQQWLVAGNDTFSYTSNGFVINIPGFDASSQDWTIMVQKISSQ